MKTPEEIDETEHLLAHPELKNLPPAPKKPNHKK